MECTRGDVCHFGQSVAGGPFALVSRTGWFLCGFGPKEIHVLVATGCENAAMRMGTSCVEFLGQVSLRVVQSCPELTSGTRDWFKYRRVCNLAL